MGWPNGETYQVKSPDGNGRLVEVAVETHPEYGKETILLRIKFSEKDCLGGMLHFDSGGVTFDSDTKRDPSKSSMMIDEFLSVTFFYDDEKGLNLLGEIGSRLPNKFTAAVFGCVMQGIVIGRFND